VENSRVANGKSVPFMKDEFLDMVSKADTCSVYHYNNFDIKCSLAWYRWLNTLPRIDPIN